MFVEVAGFYGIKASILKKVEEFFQSNITFEQNDNKTNTENEENQN